GVRPIGPSRGPDHVHEQDGHELALLVPGRGSGPERGPAGLTEPGGLRVLRPARRARPHEEEAYVSGSDVGTVDLGAEGATEAADPYGAGVDPPGGHPGSGPAGPGALSPGPPGLPSLPAAEQ